MDRNELYTLMIPTDRNLDNIANRAAYDPTTITHLIEGVKSTNVRIRFGCFNTLVKISEKEAELLYPYFDVFAGYLNAENNILKLGGIKILANLSAVDRYKKFDRVLDRYYAFMTDHAMTTAANVCTGSPIIAKAKPYLTDKIVDHLLKVEDTEYMTSTCKNILTGKVITAFDKIFKKSTPDNAVLEFVEKYSGSKESAISKKARKFLKDHPLQSLPADIDD